MTFVEAIYKTSVFGALALSFALVVTSMVLGANSLVAAQDCPSGDNASPREQALCGAGVGSDGEKAEVEISKTLKKIKNIILVVGGVIAAIVILISAIRLTIAGGNPQSISNARNSLIYALIGLALLAVAHHLVIFVASKL